MTVEAMSANRRLQSFIDVSMDSDLIGGLVLSSRACVKLIDLSGHLTAMNEAGQSLLEIDDFDSVCNSDWASLWPVEERARIAACVEQARRGDATSFVACCPTAKGTPKWWDVSVMPIRGRTGVVQSVLAVSYDVTHVKQREAELEVRVEEHRVALRNVTAQLDAESRRLAEARNKISHVEKLRLLGQFVGNVVHDINNVLTVMQSASRLLRRRMTGAVEADILGQVDQSVERGQKLVRQLLDFGRTAPRQAEVLSPASVLEDDADMLQRLAGARVRVAFDLAEDVWPILVEPQKFQSVLFNLVANARDAMADGGKVTVSVENVYANERPADLSRGDYVMITIADEGQGMTPEVLERVGEPFFTTKGEGKGTGLGLASAFELADQTGGRVLIDSAVGKGTRVMLVMPRAAAEGELVATPEAPIDPSKHGRATLLIVENEQLVRTHLAQLLRSLDYVVLEASSEELALATALSDVSIDLVVSDLHLGSGSGIKLADRLRQDKPTLPVIFVTGSSAMGVPKGEVVIRKPIKETLLARAILEALGRLPASSLSQDALRRSERVSERLRVGRLRDVLQNWYQRSRERGRLPSLDDGRAFAAMLEPSSYLLAVDGHEEMPTFSFIEAGTAVKARLGRSPVGEVISLTDQDVIGSIGRAYQRCLSGVAFFDYARLRLGEGKTVLFERLLLPLTDDGERVTHLLGFASLDELETTGQESRE